MPARPNRGKQFEEEIKRCLSIVPKVSIDRLPDPTGGYSGVRNICDFTAFCSPNNFFIECKCLYGNTLNYKSAITQNQWDGMLEKSKIYRCVAGVVVWFIDYDITAFVPIQYLAEHRNKGNKSLNILDITQENSVKHFLVDGVRKRVMYRYLGDSFIYNLSKLSDEFWGGA